MSTGVRRKVLLADVGKFVIFDAQTWHRRKVPSDRPSTCLLTSFFLDARFITDHLKSSLKSFRALKRSDILFFLCAFFKLRLYFSRLPVQDRFKSFDFILILRLFSFLPLRFVYNFVQEKFARLSYKFFNSEQKEKLDLYSQDKIDISLHNSNRKIKLSINYHF